MYIVSQSANNFQRGLINSVSKDLLEMCDLAQILCVHKNKQILNGFIYQKCLLTILNIIKLR